MAKEILLYSEIYSWTAETIIQKLDTLLGNDVEMRLNSGGGSVFAYWGICGKMVEHGDVRIKLDGFAASAAAMMLLYANDVECWDISRSMFHRADAYVGDDPTRQKLLNDINSDFRKKLEKRVNEDKFKAVTGVSYDELFDPGKRIDVWLDAKQMKQLGIVSKVKKLNPTEQKELAEAMMEGNLWSIAAKFDGVPPKQKKEDEPPKNKIMTLEEFKAQHPALHAQILAEGEKNGIAKEKDRVGAWLAFIEIDGKKVAEGIKKGDPISQTAMAEFQVAAMSDGFLEKLKAESAKDIETDPTAAGKNAGKTQAQKDIDAFASQVDKELGLQKGK